MAVHTLIMASFTRSSLIRPSLNRFSTNSELVDPEQYHAIEAVFLAVWCSNLDARRSVNIQSWSLYLVFGVVVLVVV